MEFWRKRVRRRNESDGLAVNSPTAYTQAANCDRRRTGLKRREVIMGLRFTMTLVVVMGVGCGVDDRRDTSPDSAAAGTAQEQPSPGPIPSAPPTAVPRHKVIDNTFLPPDRGRWIHVAVDTLITRDQCRALVARYREQARPGQVAVQLPGQGALCVENFDGRGTVVHDWMWR